MREAGTVYVEMRHPEWMTSATTLTPSATG